MQEGFARIRERLKAIWDRADVTTRHLSELERRLTELEAVPSAPTMAPSPPSPIVFVSTESSPHPRSEDDVGTGGTDGTEGSIAKVAVSEDENDAEHESRPASDEPMDDMEDRQADAEDDSRDSDTEVRVSDVEDEPEAAQEPPESTTQATVQTPQTDSALGGMEAIAERGGTGSSGMASGGTSGGLASGGPASSGTASGGMGAGGAASGGSVSGGADKPIPEPITETSVLDTPTGPQEKVSEADISLTPTTATGVTGGPPIAVIGATPQALQEQGTPLSLPSQCSSLRLNTLEQAGIGRHLCS
ncbi:hypothetical protein DXG01_012051 [Tephrocybe rancida]|nr:hypothetical protein DXG01_012051 [Tephrocybe rancida]